MPKLTIKRQIQATLSLALIFSVIIFIYEISIRTDMEAIMQQADRGNSTAFNVKDARYHIVQIQQFLTDASATGNDESIEEANQHRKMVILISQEVKQNNPQLKNLIDNILVDIDNLYKTGLTMVTAYKQSQQAGNKIMSLADTGFDARSANLSEHFEDLAIRVRSERKITLKEQKQAVKFLKNTTNMSIVIFIILIFSIGALVYFRILPAIIRLNSSIKELSSGSRDLTRRLEIRRRDELGDIAVSINDFYGDLESMVIDIVRSGVVLKSSIETFHHNSSEATNSMNELHTHTDMLATAINEMTSTVAEVARNTEGAAKIANSANKSTQEGGKVVEQSITIIGTLSKDLDHSATQISRLVEHSEKIGNILNVIKSISDQTNLLALNAAIEAARAGEAGRGFAVVADEVRSLAKNTQDSTAEIEFMIGEIQSESKLVSASMNSNIEKAGETVEKSRSAGEALNEIAESVKVLADTNIQIATASEQQSIVSEEINKSIIEVSGIAEKTLGIAQEVARNSQEASENANQINSLISQFKISK